MSNPDSPLPNYLYKLIPSNAAPPDPLPEELQLSELDQESGFIHLSTATQVPGTVKRFFADEERVFILKIPFEPVKENIRWESPDAKVCGPRPGEGLFPHLYDGKLGKDEVERVVTLQRGISEWDNIMEEAKTTWLTY
ncbi:hypothetical protein P691DRAFT_796452 [Macrolepiota fuliginosa MF-IS2]|uniref:DUF952 domain-containing protein n=1 Tax=Macrolepiota fuliginosa MF-IS2 TaxID=1400762 RepID=A0A9P6C789_9AGAR|nr:hypothetical protein P691DRAFT_796452 [Macrolepiota fuliginosa MF-IS2]